jgi:hypothetical protein
MCTVARSSRCRAAATDAYDTCIAAVTTGCSETIDIVDVGAAQANAAVATASAIASISAVATVAARPRDSG